MATTFSFEEAQAPATPAASPKTFSFEDVQKPVEPKEGLVTQGAKTLGKSGLIQNALQHGLVAGVMRTSAVAKSTADLLDMYVGFGAGLAKLGAMGAADFSAALQGKEHPLQEGINWANKYTDNDLNRAIAAPFATFQGRGNAEQDQSGVQRSLQPVSEGITHAFQTLTKATGSFDYMALGDQLSQVVQNAMGAGTIDAAKNFKQELKRFEAGSVIHDAAKAGVSPEKSAQFILEQFTRNGGDPAAMSHETAAKAVSDLTGQKPMTHLEKDAVLNARKKAVELTSRNASPQEVDRIIKGNPLVGTEIAKIMAEREGVRSGPMKDTLQGEVVGPENKQMMQGNRVPDPSASPATDTFDAQKSEAVHPLSIGVIQAAQKLLTVAKETAQKNGEVPWKMEMPTDMSTEDLWGMKDQNRVTNPKSKGDLELMMDTVKKEGIKNPVTVTISTHDNMAYVTDGNTRVAAAQQLKMDRVPVKFEKTDVPFTEEQKAKAKTLSSLGIDPDSIPDKKLTPEEVQAKEELRGILGQRHPKQGGWVQTGIYGSDLKPTVSPPDLGDSTGKPSSALQHPELWEKYKNADFFKKQMGVVEKQLIIGTGMVFGGAVLGAYLSPNDTTTGLIGGAAFGLGAATLPKAIGAMGENWKIAAKNVAIGAPFAGIGALVDKDNPVEGVIVGSALFGLRFLPKSKIHPEDQLINAYYGNRLAEERLSAQITKAMQDTIPDKAHREQLAVLAENPSFVGRTQAEKLFIATHRKLTDTYSTLAKDAGVKLGFIESYVSHIVEGVGVPQSEVQKIIANMFGGAQGGMSGKARFTKERQFATFAELEKALPPELKIKTKDLAEIDKIYTQAMTQTIEKQKLINNLKNATLGDPKGENAKLITSEQMPGYVHLNNPQLVSSWIHPDIAPSLKFVFDARTHGDAVNGLMALNRATKRINVVGSFFHAKSLFEAYALAGGNLLTANQAIKSALKQFHEGGLGDEVDKGIRSGLVVKMPEDVSAQALAQVGQLADHYVNKMLGTQTATLEKAGQWAEGIQKNTFDKFTWDYIHPGLKVATYLRLMEDFKLGKAPKGMPEEQYRQATVSHVNKTFGGANWYQLVSEAKTEAGRKLAMGTLNPAARDWLGVAMFAPDWTISTFRAIADALPGGAKNPMAQKLAQRYALRTAILYATTLNTINYVLSGHNMWDNKDPTRLDNGDGTTTQAVKHSMEFSEWVTAPAKTFGNKMGFIPRNIEVLQTGKQYPGGPPVTGSRLGYVAQQVMPFSAKAFQGDIDGSNQAARSLLSMFGVQVMGMTEEEKQQSREARRQRKEQAE